jgi:glucan phosphoethanolaminetransferase (alkaline phosphatase superfamily)
LANQPIINEADAAAIDVEYAKRLRSLLSVDEEWKIVVALHALLTKHEEWENTFLIYTSDHGYSQGQYRLCSHKMQVYDNNLRVPMLGESYTSEDRASTDSSTTLTRTTS